MDKLMKGKKGIVMGVLNDHSIASGIAKSLSNHGADIALTYQNESLLNRVEKVGKKLNSNIFIKCFFHPSIYTNNIYNTYIYMTNLLIYI